MRQGFSRCLLELTGGKEWKMKVTIEADGSVSLHIDMKSDNVSATLELITLLRNHFVTTNGAKPVATKPVTVATKPTVKRKQAASAPGDLSGSLFATLKTMARNDTEKGLNVNDLILLLGEDLSPSAVSQRLLKLYGKGYIYRVDQGRYRAVQPPEVASAEAK